MRHQFTGMAAAASLFLTACGGDTTGPSKPNDGTARTMSARIDGAEWSAMSIAIDSMPPSLLVVRGENTTQSFTLVIPMNQGAGPQTVGGPTPMAAVLVAGPQWWAASRTQGGSGTITLTTIAPGHVAGTFEFTLEGRDFLPRRVTSGRIDVKY